VSSWSKAMTRGEKRKKEKKREEWVAFGAFGTKGSRRPASWGGGRTGGGELKAGLSIEKKREKEGAVLRGRDV